MTEKMAEIIKDIKEANEALEFAMRRFKASNKKMDELIKELESGKKS